MFRGWPSFIFPLLHAFLFSKTHATQVSNNDMALRKIEKMRRVIRIFSPRSFASPKANKVSFQKERHAGNHTDSDEDLNDVPDDAWASFMEEDAMAMEGWGRRRRRRRRSRRRRNRRRIPGYLRPRGLYFQVKSNHKFIENIGREIKGLKGSDKPLVALGKTMQGIERKDIPKTKSMLAKTNKLIKSEDDKIKKLTTERVKILKAAHERIDNANKLSKLAIQMSTNVRQESEQSVKAAVNAEAKARLAREEGVRNRRKSITAGRLAIQTRKYDRIALRESATSMRESAATRRQAGSTVKESRHWNQVSSSTLEKTSYMVKKTKKLEKDNSKTLLKLNSGQKNIAGLTKGLAATDSFEKKIAGVIRVLEAQDKQNKETQKIFKKNQQRLKKQLAKIKKNLKKADAKTKKTADLTNRVKGRTIAIEEQMDKIEDMSDALQKHLDEEEDLAMGTEEHRETLEDMQDTMDKTLEAVTALSDGLEKQQQKMEVRRQKIESRDHEINDHQRKVKAADRKLQAHVGAINKAAADNQAQQNQIEHNIKGLKKHQKMIKEMAEDVGVQTKNIAQVQLQTADNKNVELNGHLVNSKAHTHKLDTSSAQHNESLMAVSQETARLEDNQVILRAEVQGQKENITAEEGNATKDDDEIKKIAEEDKLMNAAFMRFFIALGVILVVMILFTCVKLSRMKKVFEEPKPEEAKPGDGAEAFQEEQEEGMFAQ